MSASQITEDGSESFSCQQPIKRDRLERLQRIRFFSAFTMCQLTTADVASHDLNNLGERAKAEVVKYDFPPYNVAPLGENINQDGKRK